MFGWEAFASSLHMQSMQEQLEAGVRAWVELYYLTNTDAIMIEPEALGALDVMLSHVSNGLDVGETIMSAEDMINSNGGVTSHSDGTRHLVRTYDDDCNLLPYALPTDANTVPAP